MPLTTDEIVARLWEQRDRCLGRHLWWLNFGGIGDAIGTWHENAANLFHRRAQEVLEDGQ